MNPTNNTPSNIPDKETLYDLFSEARLRDDDAEAERIRAFIPLGEEEKEFFAPIIPMIGQERFDAYFEEMKALQIKLRKERYGDVF